jgi:hypothetical protein
MNPRKKESKKWTKLPGDLLSQIKNVFEQNFKAHLEGKKLTVEGRMYPSEIVLRVGFQNKGELRFNNFEVSLDHSKEKQNAISQIHIGVDAIASLMMDYFENEEDHEMPLSWQEYPFDKQTIWLQYSSANSELEAAADKLLGIGDDEDLLGDDRDADDLKAELGVAEDENESEDDEEDVDMSQPQIFGGGKKKKKDEMH